MKILRSILVSLLALLLSTVLFGATWSRVGIATIHNRQAVKNWFNKGNFYNQAVDAVLEKAKSSSKTGGTESIPIDDPAIQAIAKQAFSPTFLQKNIEGVLDGTYNWLDGSAKDLAFSIDLTSAKQQLATGLGTYASNRAASLPVCSTGQGAGEFDAFQATCRPSGLSAAVIGQQTTDSLLNQDFLKNPVLTADNFKIKNSDGTSQPISSNTNAKIAKTVYQKSSTLPLALILIAIILSLGIIFISSDRLRGLRRVGYVFASTGVLLGASYLVLGYGVNKLANQITSSSSPKQNKMFIDLINVITSDIKGVLALYTTVFIAVGIICYAGALIIKGRRKHRLGESSETIIDLPKADATNINYPAEEPKENTKI